MLKSFLQIRRNRKQNSGTESGQPITVNLPSFYLQREFIDQHRAAQSDPCRPVGRKTVYSHAIYNGSHKIQPRLRSFLYEAHATGKKLRLLGENWPDSFIHGLPDRMQLHSKASRHVFFLRSINALPVLTIDRQSKCKTRIQSLLETIPPTITILSAS